MKTIKTRNSVKDIKALDKSVNLSKRMKNSFIRTKERAEETQNSNYDSPTDYASTNIQNTTHDVAQETVHHLPNPRQNASKNIQRAKRHFQEVKNQMPNERRRVAEQTQKTAHRTQANADHLKKTADNAKESAQEAKKAVKDAKQTLREVRQNGRQTLREVKQNIKIDNSVNTVNKPSTGRNNLSNNTANMNPAQKRFVRNRQRKIRTRNNIQGDMPQYRSGTSNITSKKPLNSNPAQGSIPKSEPIKSGNMSYNEVPRFNNSNTPDIAPKNGNNLSNNTAKQKFIQNRQIKTYRVKKVETKNKGLSNNSKNANPVQNGKMANTPNTSGKPLNTSVNNSPYNYGSRPSYLNRGIRTYKNTGDTAKSLNKTTKTVKYTKKGVKKTAKGTIKTAKNSIKTAEKSAKTAVKTAQQTAKTAQKTAQASAKAAKAAAKAAQAATKAAIKAAKITVKAVIAAVKAVIAAIKGLVAAIAAGGWVAVVVILIICLIALVVGSVYSIFFSSDPDPATGMSINGVIMEIDTEYTDKIDEIIIANAHDILDMSGARAEWKQVLAVYTVKTVTDPDNPMEVATMDDTKAAILRNIFWDMNTISYITETVEIDEDILDENGEPTGEIVTIEKTVLRITVTHKTLVEISAQYGFTAEQKEWLDELLKPEYDNFWSALLYGISSGSLP